MLARILPLVTIFIIIFFFSFLVHKKKRHVMHFAGSKKTSVTLAALIMILHVAFATYYGIVEGVYLYLLHTDLCTMLYPWVGVALVLNKRKMLQILMPIAIAGAFFELASQKITFESHLALEEITSYFKHIILLLIGIYVFINASFYKWNEFWKSIIWLLCYIVYIFLVVGIAYGVTKNQKFGAFSMGFVTSSYEEVNVSWTTSVISSEYTILKGWGYPFGTIALSITAVLFMAAISLGAHLTSKYEITATKPLMANAKKLLQKTGGKKAIGE